MLVTIPLLTGLLFSTIYPLCFWLGYKSPLKQGFHKFHLGLPCCVAGVTFAGLTLLNVSTLGRITALVWLVALIAVTAFYWTREYPHPGVVTIPVILGILAFAVLQNELIGPQIIVTVISLLGALILCLSLYTMNLGHHYLNVHGLSLDYLKQAVYAFAVCLTLRAVWDGIALFSQTTLYQGDPISLYQFLFTMDGFLLLIALFFGTLFPLAALYFVHGTLKVKSTQSATGILYVILVAVLIGDITYKYYLVRYQIVL